MEKAISRDELKTITDAMSVLINSDLIQEAMPKDFYDWIKKTHENFTQPIEINIKDRKAELVWLDNKA